MSTLTAKHEKEQRDLQSQISQKKRSASKKTRKSVNDECRRLEEELKAKQALDRQDWKDNASAAEDDPQTGANEDGDLLASIAGDAPISELQKLDVNEDGAHAETQNKDGEQRRKPNRQKARLARRAAEQEEAAAKAAEEAANMPDRKQIERERMLKEIEKRNLVEHHVDANGHCLYLAVADQLRFLKIDVGDNSSEINSETEKKPEDYKIVRHKAADYISDHAEEFEPFLEEPMKEYLHKIRETGEWGGHLELLALAKSYKIDINVLQSGGRPEKIECCSEGQSPEAWLVYYRHGYGLGEHYNSLQQTRKADTG